MEGIIFFSDFICLKISSYSAYVISKPLLAKKWSFSSMYTREKTFSKNFVLVENQVSHLLKKIWKTRFFPRVYIDKLDFSTTRRIGPSGLPCSLRLPSDPKALGPKFWPRDLLKIFAGVQASPWILIKTLKKLHFALKGYFVCFWYVMPC